MILVDLIGVGY